jgi:hypothetical protein
VKERALFALWRVAAALRHPARHRRFLRRMRRWPEAALPVAHSDRVFWRKLFDRDPRFVPLSDKLAVRGFWAEHAPEVALPRLLWVGERAEDIPPDLLRPGVVLKATHGSGWNLFCGDPPPPHAEAVATARRWLAERWGERHGEWAYAAVPPRLIAEEMIVPPRGEALFDVKVHAGGGRVGVVQLQIGTGREGAVGELCDAEGRRLGVGVPGLGPLPPGLAPPPGFAGAVAVAARLSDAFDCLRFDVLVHGGRLFAGEVTVFPSAGYRDYPAEPAASLMRAAWDLRRSWFLREGAAQGGWLAQAYAAALARALGAEHGAPQ